MRLIFAFHFVMLCLVNLQAQNIAFNINNVPKEVRAGADWVMRSENIEFEVSQIEKSKLNVQRIITVLNEKGREKLFFIQPTDKYITIEDFEARVFDSTGKELAKFKQKDLGSRSHYEGLMSDVKLYYLDIPSYTLPVTVAYKYEIGFKGSLQYPAYDILEPGEGIENSSYTVRILNDLDLRYKEKNIHLDPALNYEGRYKIYNWNVRNLAPLEYEEGAVSYESRYPSILLAPNKFKVEDFEGNMTSWNEFGKWYQMLSQGADQLPDERKKFFNDLVKDAKSDRQKAAILYKYLQDNLRYVSIQLGIGGYKPFPANETDQKKYGDCKALSNYMQSILKSVGIRSYQALVNAEYNKDPVDQNFPCNLFNHVILCIPQPNDSIWLECTSRTQDFGSLGTFTENRNALLITEHGGELVPTPKSKSSNNCINGKTTVQLNEDGSGKSFTSLVATGEYKGDLQAIKDENADDQKKWFNERMGFKEPSEVKFDNLTKHTGFEVTIDQALESVAELKVGSKMFLPIRLYNLTSFKLPKSEHRKLDFYFNCPFEKSDTTIFKLPSAYKLDALPSNKDSHCAYASYSTKYIYDSKNQEVISMSKLVLTQYKISAADFASVKKFFEEILVDNQERIVVAKN